MSFFSELAKHKYQPVTLYHGTSSKHIPGILKHGLDFTPKNSVWHQWGVGSEKNKEQPDFNIHSVGNGPSMGGVYGATNFLVAHQYAAHAASKHKGNKAFVEYQSHPRRLHVDDDVLAATLRNSYDNPYSSRLAADSRRYQDHRKSAIARGKTDDLPEDTRVYHTAIRDSRKAFRNKFYGHYEQDGFHLSPQQKAKIDPHLQGAHDALHHIHYVNHETPFGTKVNHALLKTQHAKRFRNHMSAIADLLHKHNQADPEEYWHDEHNPTRVNNRIKGKVGYKGHTRIKSVFEMEPDAEKNGHWLKYHYHEGKEPEPSIKLLHHLNTAYNVLGVKDKDNKVKWEF